MAAPYPYDDEYRRQRGPRARGGRANEFTPPTTAPTPTPTMPSGFGGYDDPFTNLLTTTAMGRMAKLSQPYSDPGLDEVVNLIRGKITGLQNEPQLFTPQEEDRLFTKGWDTLEQRRTGAKQRATEDAARRGLGETSGVIQEQYRDIDRSFDADRTRGEADIAMYMTNERNQRRTQRDGQILQMAGMLADYAAQRRGEQRANENDTLQIATMLSQLGPQRLALAMNVLNGSGGNDVSGLFNNTLNLSNTQTNANQNSAAARQNFLLGLGQLLGGMGGNQR